MTSHIKKLKDLGLSEEIAERFVSLIKKYQEKHGSEQAWKKISADLFNSNYSFPIYQLLYQITYPDWDKIPAPAWFPDEDFIKTTNIAKVINQLGCKNYQELLHLSITDFSEFWQTMIKTLNIIFDKEYQSFVDLSKGIELSQWLVGAKLNIANSCFKADKDKVCIISQQEHGSIKKMTYEELNKLSNRVANSISTHFNIGDCIAIILPMTLESVAIYLGIIKAGCCVVSIPESFSASEISIRLRIANVKAVFTQEQITRGGKHFPLYEKIIDANAPFSIILPNEHKLKQNLRKQDISWSEFLSNNESFTAISCNPDAYTNILFSSGVTGEPKAIPWTHTTPIKCASDAYLHLNFQADDIICWPSSLGWMMGPWLIYAGLINNTTIALYEGTPNEKAFGKFIQDAKVTFLGLIPTIIKHWRNSGCMEEFDFQTVKLFSSTGECSNIDDMLYLMWLGHYKPIIEYCGGTEIGGAYITGTMIENCAPSAFTSHALGLGFEIINEDGISINNGEVALIPPSIGLSTSLLNKNHHKIYYANMPLVHGKILRRHGDQTERFSNGFYRVHGRVDDTIKLSGIKVSSSEIEFILNQLPQVLQSAAIAINPPIGGPSQLIIYVVPEPDYNIDIKQLIIDLQNAINQSLNPLFKIHDVVMVNVLPRSASNKIMRRVLRENYKKNTGLPKLTHEKKICLALQGGGSHGAYTWGILDRFLEDDRFIIDAISATSAGSVNAVVLANGFSKGGNHYARKALNDFWYTLSHYGSYLSPIREISPDIFKGWDFDFFAQFSFICFDIMTRTFSPYQLNPFGFDIVRYILLEQINFEELRRDNKIKLFLSATNVKTGMLKIFENPEITVDAVIASACLPNLNRAIEINNEFYWDGGYLGNPPIYPLIYNSQVNDILIIHNNPITRDTLPMNSTDIASRINEISFNSSLIRELRAIAFITKIIDKGWIKEEYKDRLKRKSIHIIRSDEVMNQFSLANKFNWHWEFISHLRDLGRIRAETWIKNNFNHLGKKPTIDFQEILGDDTQTLDKA